MFAAHVVFDHDENFYDGRSSILFATVAGVSLGLLTGGSRPAPREEWGYRRASIALRGAALILIGVLLTTLVRPPLQVILDYYGLAFILLVPLLFARRPVLAVAALLVVAIAPPVVGWLRAETDPQAIPVVLAPFAQWLVYGSYPVAIWLAFPLFGLICARSGLERRRTQLLMIGAGTLAAVLGYGAAQLLPGVTAEAHSGSAAEVIGSGGLAVAIIGLATLLGSIAGPAGRSIRFVLFPVAAAGGMALSLYTAQAIALTIVREANRIDAERWTYPAAILPVLIVSALVIGTLWRLFLGAGPLERVLRWLTSWSGPRRVEPSAAPRV
ncbi:MAG: DUF418 domain-containing protein [Pseudolysinimonas sp.]